MPVRGKNGGNAGQGSKWIRRARRLAIYARDRWRCVWCNEPVSLHSGPAGAGGGPYAPATLDHVLPRERGGTNETGNLITSCMKCNRLRGARPIFAFALLLSADPNKRNGQSWIDSARAILWRVADAVKTPLPGATSTATRPARRPKACAASTSGTHTGSSCSTT